MGADARVALVYGVSIGAGGLAVQSANAIAALAVRAEVHAFGPRPQFWPRVTPEPSIRWHPVLSRLPWWSGWPGLRRLSGTAQLQHDTRLGRTAAAALGSARPVECYAFTHVALESLRWARDRGIRTTLESPNGHIRAFRRVYVEEQRRWCGGRYTGHPSPEMVVRVEQEYALADRIRVSSEWAKRSLIAGGVPEAKISVLQQPVDLQRFTPAERSHAHHGPLRVVFVGSLDLRKGFVYLLGALRKLGNRISLELIGGTVDRCTRRLLESEAGTLGVRASPGDAVAAYHRSEVCVLPTLEDGSPFAAAEAMACGLPLVTTGECGAAEWVRAGRSGWIVPARDEDALVDALEDALRRRDELGEMGRLARQDTEVRADPVRCDQAVADWVFDFRTR